MCDTPLDGRNLPTRLCQTLKSVLSADAPCCVLPVTMLCDDVGRNACIKYGDFAPVCAGHQRCALYDLQLRDINEYLIFIEPFDASIFELHFIKRFRALAHSCCYDFAFFVIV